MKYYQKTVGYFKSLSAIDRLSILFLVYIFCFLFVRLVSFSTDIGGAEYSFLYIVQLVQKNTYIYRDPDQFPFFVSMYPPLFPYITYTFLKILHVNLFTDIHRALVTGRLISLSLWLVDLWLIKKIIANYFTSTYQKIFPFLLFTLLLTIHYFAFRPDSAKLTLFISFLYFILKRNFNDSEKISGWIALLFGIAAVFFKHDIAIYIGLYFAVYFLFDRKREAVIYSFVFVIGIALGFFLFSKIFGDYFFRNVFNYNVQYPSDITLNLLFIGLSVVKTLPLIIITILNLRSKDKKTQFIATLGGVYFIISNLTLFRVGADLNYTYESAILLVINYCIYFTVRVPKFKWTLLLTLYLLLFNKYLFNLTSINHYNLEKERKLYDEKINNSNAIRKITRNDVVFYAYGRYLIFNIASNLIYGYDLHMERSMELTYHYPLKTIMYSNTSVVKYDRLYNNGFVKYIVIENDDIALEQMRKYYKNYYFYAQAGNLLLYKFNPI